MKKKFKLIGGVLSSVFLVALIMAPAQSRAAMTTLDFYYTIDQEVTTYTSTDRLLGPSAGDPLDGDYFSAGINLNATHTQTHTISVPLYLSLAYDDEVVAGQDVVLTPSYSLIGTPTFRTESAVTFNTSFRVDAEVSGLSYHPDERILTDTLGATLGGSFGLDMTGNIADENVVSKTIWESAIPGGPLIIPTSHQFDGLERFKTGPRFPCNGVARRHLDSKRSGGQRSGILLNLLRSFQNVVHIRLRPQQEILVHLNHGPRQVQRFRALAAGFGVL